jgi:hypothetical protein
MITTLLKFHNSMATWASLPTHFRCKGLERQGLSIVSAVFIWMGLILAGSACTGVTGCAGDFSHVF